MNATNLITEVYYAYRGKGATRVPVWGSEKQQTALAIANRKTVEWATDSDQIWASNFAATAPNEAGTVATAGTTALTGTDTYFTDYNVGDQITVSGETVRTIDTIVSDTSLTVTVAFANTASAKTFTRTTIIASAVQAYSLNRKLIAPASEVLVTTSTQDVPLQYTKPQSKNDGDVYISGRNPRLVTFYNDIESTSQLVGGTLKIAGYYLPDELVNQTDLVSVDDANWLVYATAAELARNDPAKDDQFGNLVGMANDLYRKMIAANRNLGFLQGSTIPTNMPLLGDQTEEW